LKTPKLAILGGVIVGATDLPKGNMSGSRFIDRGKVYDI
jgi:hypothetical protein